MKPGSTAPIQHIGSRLLQLAERLCHLPAQDAPTTVMRELTTLPSIRLAERVAPFCGGDATVRTHAHQASAGQASDAAILPSPSLKTAGLFGDSSIAARALDENDDAFYTPARILRRSAKGKPAAAPKRGATSPPLAGVFQAMYDSNLPQADRPEKAVAPAARRLTDRAGSLSPHYTPQSTAVTVEDDQGTPPDRSLEQARPALSQANPDAFNRGATGAEKGLKKPVSPSNAIDSAPVTRMRMAQGAPAIAALLKANLAGVDQAPAEPQRPAQDRDMVHDPDNDLPDDRSRHSTPADDLPGVTGTIDMDRLMEQLARQLEFEFQRTYGTSGKYRL